MRSSELSKAVRVRLRNANVGFVYDRHLAFTTGLYCYPVDDDAGYPSDDHPTPGERRMFSGYTHASWVVPASLAVRFTTRVVTTVGVKVTDRYAAHRCSVFSPTTSGLDNKFDLAGIVVFDRYYAGFVFPAQDFRNGFTIFDPKLATDEAWWSLMLDGARVLRAL